MVGLYRFVSCSSWQHRFFLPKNATCWCVPMQVCMILMDGNNLSRNFNIGIHKNKLIDLIGKYSILYGCIHILTWQIRQTHRVYNVTYPHRSYKKIPKFAFRSWASCLITNTASTTCNSGNCYSSDKQYDLVRKYMCTNNSMTLLNALIYSLIRGAGSNISLNVNLWWWQH